MIFAWLTTRTLGLARGWWLLGLVIALAVAVIWLRAAEDADDRRNQEIGAAAQRESDLRETLDRVKEANDAERKITADPDARRAGCLRHSRTPENC